MDADFIAYYKENIDFLREKSEIFAQQYPTIAQNLGLSSFECADPFVERVLEGVAFLAARNEQKLDQGATFILQDLLSTLAPALALPHPALGNFKLTNLTDKTLSFEQGTQFKTKVKNTDCKFSTLFKVELTPAVFSEPQQHFQPLNPGFPGKSSLSLQLDINSITNLPDDIEIYLNLPDLEAGLLAQYLTLNLCGVYFQAPPAVIASEMATATATATAPTSAVTPSVAAPSSAAPASASLAAKAAITTATTTTTSANSAALAKVNANENVNANTTTWALGARPIPNFTAPQVSAPASTPRIAETELIKLQVNTVSLQQSRLEQELMAAGLSPNTIDQAFFNGSNLLNAADSLSISANPVVADTKVGATANARPWSNTGAETGETGGINSVGSADRSYAGAYGETYAGGIGTGTIASNANVAYAGTGSDSGAAAGISAELSILVKPNLLDKLMGTGNGINYLTLYTAYPQLCKYVVLKGLGKALRHMASSSTGAGLTGRVIFAFNTQQPKLNLGNTPFLTNVLPLINLFPKRCSYTQLSMRSHYHVIPERTQPDDFEVFTISSLEILGSAHVVSHTALPFFNQSLEPDQLFFIQERHERTKGTFIPRSSYLKSECFVTLCGANFKPLLEPHLSMVANTYCSNADLPLFIKQGHKLKTLDEGGQVSLLDLKLNVEPALIMRSNQQSYALLAYFNLHLHNLISQSEEQIKLRLQELIKAYATPHGNPELELLAQALYQVEKTPKTFRHLQHGIVFFEPGLQLKLYFDPEKSGGSSLFFFARILCAVLQSFVPLNEHCEVLAYTKQGVLLTHSATFQESSPLY